MKKQLNFSNVLLVGLVLLPFLMRLTPLGQHFGSVAEALGWMRRLGLDSPGPFLAATLLLLLLGVPRTILGFAAGALFGLASGLALSLAPVLLVAGLVFFLVRRRRRERVSEKLPRAWLKVALLRQIPAPAMLLNAWISRISPTFGSYCLGTLLGILPQGVLAVAAGAGLASQDTIGQWKLVALPLAALLWLVVARLGRISARGGLQLQPPPAKAFKTGRFFLNLLMGNSDVETSS
jgi:uncharacterized membrane protein YdjX (TVP38/TMEM64 family)